MLFASRKACQEQGQKGTETQRGGRPEPSTGAACLAHRMIYEKKRMHAQDVYDMGLGR